MNGDYYAILNGSSVEINALLIELQYMNMQNMSAYNRFMFAQRAFDRQTFLVKCRLIDQEPIGELFLSGWVEASTDLVTAWREAQIPALTIEGEPATNEQRDAMWRIYL